MSKTIIIFGSSRNEGNTSKATEKLREIGSFHLINLNDLDISYYDYENTNLDDDFLPTIEKIIKYENLVFATPIYWYSMAAVMKTFFDRFTNLITVRKDLGRLLKGKNVFLMSCSANPQMSEGFSQPFKATADYLKMNYKGDLHIFAYPDNFIDMQNQKIVDFVNKIITA